MYKCIYPYIFIKYVHEYNLFFHSKLMLLVMTFSSLSVIFSGLTGQLLYPSGLVDNPKFIKTGANLRMLAK